MKVVSAITACNRSALLERNIRSQVGATEITIFDDSSDGRMRFVAESLTTLSVPIRYVGTRERAIFASQFHSSLRGPLLWGLSNRGYSLGANRNAVLLDTLGSKVFLSDDDIVCRVGKSKLAGRVVFKTRQEALDAVEFTDKCPLDICLEALVDYRVAMFGHVGDSGARSPQKLPDGTFSREIVHTGPSVLTDGGFLMLGAAAIDNAGLPPFYPHGRNSDGLWGIMLKDLGVPVTMLPWALEHDPKEVRPLTTRRGSPCDEIAVIVRQGGAWQNAVNEAGHCEYTRLVENWDRILEETKSLQSKGERLSIAIN